MKLFKAIVVTVALALALVAWPAAAQTQSLNVPGGTDNAARAIMFDITAANTVTITGFSLRAIQTDGPVRVYGRVGTHVGNTGSSAGWTLLASGVMSSGADVAFPSAMSMVIPAGQTGAIYIASDDVYFEYRSGTGVGNTVVADADIALLEGTAKSAPDFSPIDYTQRIFVGSVSYLIGSHAPAPAPIPTLSEWALILLGVALAGAAVIILRRRFAA